MQTDPADPADPTPTPEPTPAPAPQPAAPPAAVVVNAGELTERNADLQRQLDAEREDRRKAQVKCAEAEDEAHRLKKLVSVRPKRGGGWTLLHDPED